MTMAVCAAGTPPLDEVLGGGLPVNGISIIMGLPGTGKTILAQQYAFHNAEPDRPALFFSTLSEPLEKIIRFGQTLDFLRCRRGRHSRCSIEDLGQVASRDGLAGVGDHVARSLKQRRPGLVVIDSFKALHALADSDAGFRQFLHELAWRLDGLPGRDRCGSANTSPARRPTCARVRRGRCDHRTSPPSRSASGKTVPARPEAPRQRLPVRPARLPAHPQGLRLFPRLADIPHRRGLPARRQADHLGHPRTGRDAGRRLLAGRHDHDRGPLRLGQDHHGAHFL